MHNTIEMLNTHGDVVLRTAEGHYVLTQQIDAQPLHMGQVLEGMLETIGIEPATDPQTGVVYEFFIAAYGLSREAALDSLG